MKLFEKIKKSKTDLYLLVVLAVSFILRFLNLGYADFQGDEIKALFSPDSFSAITQFLLSQRKGPLQFLATFLIKQVDPTYTNQFLVRLPFTIAGFLAVYFFYKLVKIYFDKKVAFYAAMLMATNGFFVAFARIAQYQSFVILFCVLTLYELTLAVKEQKMRAKGIYLASLFWSLALLAHYDAVFILPAALMLFVQWLKLKDVRKLKTLSLAFVIFAALTLTFYIPFALYISKDTKAYWAGRLIGDVSDKVSSSYYLFTVYQPIYIIHFYIGFFALALVGLMVALFPNAIKKFFLKIPLVKNITKASMELINQQVTLAVFFTVLFWFALAFMFWEKVVYIPGTHIYTYLLPAFILIGFGMHFLETVWLYVTSKLKILKPVLIKNTLITAFFLFAAMQSYVIFVDNTQEYPWQEEKFLIWTLFKPSPSFHLSMFGFPYFRDWESIGKFISSHPEVEAYSTNERDSISRYYIKLQKDTDKAGFYVFIMNPQSFADKILNDKALYWASKNPPVYTLSRSGTDLVNIYLMPTGTYNEIRAQGY